MTQGQMLTEYRSRLNGLLSISMHQKTVLAVGCGAGSYMLEKLARSAPAVIRLVDFDTVEWPNLARTAFGASDVGSTKVAALSRHIKDACPLVEVEGHCRDICAMPEGEVAALMDGADIIIAGTDHFPAQALLNKWSQALAIPAVFIGIHAGALGGRVIWSEPGRTACYRCVARERYDEFAREGSTGTDLNAAHGCIADVQAIDMVALKICLALLERGQESAMGRFYERMEGRNEVIIRNSPDYGYGEMLWDAVLADLPTAPRPYAREIKDQVLFAHDSMWLHTERVADCPDCGSKS